jgi:hypothetical protein
MREPADILTAMRDEAQTLRANRAAMAPARVNEFLAELEAALSEYNTWLDEEDVISRSGRGAGHWRGRFPDLMALNMARIEGQGRRQRRQYRACVVPARANLHAAREDARAAARRVG